jgi:hypothetical protein
LSQRIVSSGRGGGKAVLKTVQGEDLTAMMDGDKLVLTDAHGGKSTVTIADARRQQSQDKKMLLAQSEEHLKSYCQV